MRLIPPSHPRERMRPSVEIAATVVGFVVLALVVYALVVAFAALRA